LLQACWADLNAGDWGLMSLGITSPLCGLGSGKFGTACARRHRAYSSAGSLPALAPDGRLEDPQAVIMATTQITVASAPSERRKFRAARSLGVRVLFVASLFIGSPQLYVLAGNAGRTVAVTPLLGGVRDPQA
jgi:hypothetical protein